jgi:hypothetical protein
MGYKFKPNNTYFKEIDSEYKAYILGLIYADGSIIPAKNGRQHKLSVSLQEEDAYILEKLSKDIINREVIIRHPPSIKSRGWKKRATVVISSDEIGETLISYGCNINKSRVGMTFPLLRNDLIHHFIRGFMDGDGCITLGKRNYKYKRKRTWKVKNAHLESYRLRLAFTSTDAHFLGEIVKYLPTDKYKMNRKQRKQFVYTLWIERQKEVLQCLDYIYKDAHYFLKRKYEKLIEFKKTIKSLAEGIPSEGLETT